MKLNVGCNLAWPTPIYRTRLSEKECDSLAADLMVAEDLGDPMGDSSSNLINTIPSLKEAAEKKYAEFFRHVYDIDIQTLDYEYKAWLTGSKGGYSMETHNHTGAQFVSVFYVMAEEQDAGGEIVLQDPRFNANRGYMDPFIQDFESFVHNPRTGDVLIFPGYVYHYVRQYTSQLRLAVPVDIFIKG